MVFTGNSGSLTSSATLALTVAAAGTSVTTYHNDNARDGWNSSETVLTPQTVNATTFGKLRQLSVDGKVDAQPLYVSSLSIAGQTRNVLITVTEHGTAYAFDADGGPSCGTSARSQPTRPPATITVAPRSRPKSASPIHP